MFWDSGKQLFTLPCHLGIIFILLLLKPYQENGTEWVSIELERINKKFVQ